MNKLTIFQQGKIYQEIELDNSRKVIVLDYLGLKNLPKDDMNKNIFCINKEFEIIWQIDPEPTEFEIDSFTSINKEPMGDLVAKKFSGFKYKINFETGQATIIDWNK